MTARHWLHDAADVAAAVAENPPDLPGWEIIGRAEPTTPADVLIGYTDDDGAVAWVVLRVVSVDLDERRVPPEQPDRREPGDSAP